MITKEDQKLTGLVQYRLSKFNLFSEPKLILQVEETATYWDGQDACRKTYFRDATSIDLQNLDAERIETLQNAVDMAADLQITFSQGGDEDA